jgi:uncharacterized protein (DUF3820 family)
MGNELGITDPMPIGKYRGQLVGTIIEEDPSYIRWMINNTEWRLDEAALEYLGDE